MTGSLPRNGRAIRQISLLQSIAERLDVFAAEADEAASLLAGNVNLHPIPKPATGGPKFFWSNHKAFVRALGSAASDVFHASDLYVLPSVARAAAKRDAALVYDARELYPFVQGTVGKPIATFFWSQLEGRYISRADAVFTVSDSISQRIAEAYGIDPPVVMHNVPHHKGLNPTGLLRDSLTVPDSEILLLHLGDVREGRGGSTLVEALARTTRTHLVFVGSGSAIPALRSLADAAGVADRVHFMDQVPYESVLDVAAGADVGVTLLEDTCLNHRLALPNKLFEYLGAGLPVIGSDLVEIGNVIRTFDVGLTVDPSDVRSVASAIQTMADEPERRHRWSANTAVAVETFGWPRASERMLEAYLTLGIGTRS